MEVHSDGDHMLKTCKNCSVEFKTDKKTARYCSRPCFDIGRRVDRSCTCTVCNAVFLTNNHRTALYCSMICSAIGRKKRNPIPCAYCATVFNPPNAKSKCCSVACGVAIRKGRPVPARMNGTTKQCTFCNADIYVTKGVLKEHNFCSVSCHDAYQRRNKVARTCSICSREFLLSPSKVKQSAGRYCSIACRTACPIWKSRAAIAANRVQIHKNGPNRLELAGRSILDDLCIPYLEQVLIADKFSVDVQLVGLPIVIQWDGDYWHGYRPDDNARPLDHRQIKRSALDLSQDAYMRSCGLTVLRFWEHDVHNNKKMVSQSINSAVSGKS